MQSRTLRDPSGGDLPGEGRPRPEGGPQAARCGNCAQQGARQAGAGAAERAGHRGGHGGEIIVLVLVLGVLGVFFFF